MLRFPSILGIAAVGLVFANPFPVFAEPQIEPQITKPIYAWKTESENDKKSGRFHHCLVKNMYDNGTMLMLAQNHDGMERLALNFPQEKMQAGTHFDLTLQVDQNDVFPVEAVAASSQVLTIGIPQGFPDQLRKGEAMYMRGPNDEVVFTLNGMDGAVSALRDCVTTNLHQAETVQTATVSKDDKKVEIAAAEIPEPVIEKKTEEKPVVKPVEKPIAAKKKAAKAESTVKTTETPILPKELQDIVARAGLLPDALLLGKAGAAADRPLDYAWLHDDLFVGIKQQNAVPFAGLTQAATFYLRKLKERCSGPFVAEAGNAIKGNGQGWLVAETACTDTDNGDMIAALLFVTDGQKMRIYFTEGKADQGGQIIRTRDALRRAVLK